MSWLNEAWSRLRGQFRRSSMERELDEEMRFHLEQQVERNLARGMSPQEARRNALLKFGGVDRFKEASREEHRSRPLEDLWQDVLYGARLLRRSPLFATVAILSLAVGAGANSAVFSVVDAVLLKPLPYSEPERLFHLFVHDQGKERGSSFSAADYVAMESARSFAAVGASYRSELALTGGGSTEVLSGTYVTPSLLIALGVEPVLGRLMVPEEAAPGAESVVLLGHEFWQRRFGGSSDVLGSTMTLDGYAYTIIGVMPPGFRVPGRPYDDVWPVMQVRQPEYRAPFYLAVIGRLAPGATEEQARAELASLQESVKAAYPGSPPTWSYTMQPLKDVLVQDTRATVLVLFGVVGLVLLIAAANVANLLLARATTRGPELAVRSALGAARGRIVRQLLAESLLITILGAAAGLGLAYVAVAALNAMEPAGLARLNEVRLDLRVLLFTVAVSVVTGVLVGIAPALRAPSTLAIREGGRGGSDGPARSRLRSTLVVTEFALALGVLIGAGLLVSSLLRLQRVDPGAAREGVLAVRVALPETSYRDEASIGAFFDGLVERAKAIPGVRAAAISMAVPPHRLVMSNPFTPEGAVYNAREAPPVADYLLVGPDYFATLDIPIIRGREFAPADRDGAPLVAIINTTMAEQYYPGVDPIGRWIQLGDPDPESPRWTIVGIVADVHYRGLELEPEPTAYVPFAQNLWWPSMYLVVRTATADAAAVLPAIRAVVADLDPDIPLRDEYTMAELIDEAVAAPRFRALLLASFAGIAVILAAAGIYGVMSYTVSRRRHEMSVRLALGARPGGIVRLVVRNGMGLAAVGVVLGLGAAAALSRVMQGMLFGVAPLDIATFAAAAAVLTFVALLACIIPALRAARLDSAAALRTD